MNVIIAGADPKIRFAISVLVQEQPGWVVDAVCSRHSELVEVLSDRRPDVLILDQDLPAGTEPVEWEELLNRCGTVILLVSTPIHRDHVLDLTRDRRIPVSKLESPETLLDLFKSIQSCSGKQ